MEERYTVTFNSSTDFHNRVAFRTLGATYPRVRLETPHNPI